MEKLIKIKRFERNVHNYRGALVVGNGGTLINAMQGEDPYNDFFWDGEGFVNQIDEIEKGKSVDCFSLTRQGGGWTTVFSSGQNTEIYTGSPIAYSLDAIFIDSAVSHLVHEVYRPEIFFSKEHVKILNQMIEKSIMNTKPIFNFTARHSQILFMGAGHEIEFHTKGDKVKIDYKRDNETVFEQLYALCHHPSLYPQTVKFVNFGTPEENSTFDFLASYLSAVNFEVYKIESLEKTVDWFANYYSKYHIGDVKKSMSKTIVEMFKHYVDIHGYTHGHYLKATEASPEQMKTLHDKIMVNRFITNE